MKTNRKKSRTALSVRHDGGNDRMRFPSQILLPQPNEVNKETRGAMTSGYFLLYERKTMIGAIRQSVYEGNQAYEKWDSAKGAA